MIFLDSGKRICYTVWQQLKQKFPKRTKAPASASVHGGFVLHHLTISFPALSLWSDEAQKKEFCDVLA